MLLNWYNKVSFWHFIPPGEQATLTSEALLQRRSSQQASCEPQRDIQSLFCVCVCVLCTCVCLPSRRFAYKQPVQIHRGACGDNGLGGGCIERGSECGVGVLFAPLRCCWGFLMWEVQWISHPEPPWEMCTSSFFQPSLNRSSCAFLFSLHLHMWKRAVPTKSQPRS